VTDISEDEVDKIVDSVVKKGRKKAPAKAVAPDAEDDLDAVADTKAEAEILAPPPSPISESAKSPPMITLEQLDALHKIVPDMPKAVENVKTIGDLISKYGIGQRPDFKLQVHRTWPKIFPGGRKADGFLDDYDQGIDEAFIANEYGGGEYLVRVVGPISGSNLGTKHYDSTRVNIQGEPKYERVSRKQQTQDAAQAPPQAAGLAQMILAPPKDDPKIVETVMGTLKEVILHQREEHRRDREAADAEIEEARSASDPLVEAEARRSEDVIRLEREKAQAEKDAIEARAQMERERAEERQRALEAQLAEAKKQAEEILRRMNEMENSRPSLGAEIRDIMAAFPQPQPPPPAPPPRGELELASQVLSQNSDKHRAEIEAMRQQHTALIESLRAAHEREIQATRDANARELAAEREAQRSRDGRHEEQIKLERQQHEREIANVRESELRRLEAERETWRHREQRYEDQIKSEREERRRDQERAREVQAERDQAAKDRLESTEANMKSQWEARLSMVETNHAERVRWLQAEIDNKTREVSDVRSKLQDTHDPVVQMTRYKELREAAQSGLGLVETSSSPSSGSSSSSSGIGLSGTGIDMNEAIQTAVERAPEILSSLGTLFRGPQPQQAAAPGGMVPGQVVQTPMGPMMVVQTEQGPQLTPVGAQPPRLLPAGQPKPKPTQQAAPQPMPPGGMVQPGHSRPAAPQRRKRGGSANFDPLPNLAEGLERPLPPWEKKPGPFAEKPAPKPAAQQQQQQQSQQQPQGPQGIPASVAMAPTPPRPEKISMNAIEKQIAEGVAKLVHESVSGGDDPEDFVDSILEGGYPTAIIEGLCQKSDQEILAGIQAVQPRSAGATPAGQQFVRQAMALLRAEVARDDEAE